MSGSRWFDLQTTLFRGVTVSTSMRSSSSSKIAEVALLRLSSLLLMKILFITINTWYFVKGLKTTMISYALK
jgi:hypothetical protein